MLRSRSKGQRLDKMSAPIVLEAPSGYADFLPKVFRLALSFRSDFADSDSLVSLVYPLVVALCSVFSQ